jgi:hypothetical protein
VAAGNVLDVWIPTSIGRPTAEEYLVRIDEETGHHVMDTCHPTIAH